MDTGAWQKPKGFPSSAVFMPSLGGGPYREDPLKKAEKRSPQPHQAGLASQQMCSLTGILSCICPVSEEVGTIMVPFYRCRN